MKNSYNDDCFSDSLSMIGLVILLIAFVILAPFLVYWCCYFDGWIASKVIGNELCHSLNYIFGTKITPSSLPKIAGGIGWIGSFFKSSSVAAKTLNSKND